MWTSTMRSHAFEAARGNGIVTYFRFLFDLLSRLSFNQAICILRLQLIIKSYSLVLRLEWTKLIWESHRAIIDGLRVCYRFYIDFCNSKWRRYEGDGVRNRLKIVDFWPPIKFPKCPNVRVNLSSSVEVPTSDLLMVETAQRAGH